MTTQTLNSNLRSASRLLALVLIALLVVAMCAEAQSASALPF